MEVRACSSAALVRLLNSVSSCSAARYTASCCCAACAPACACAPPRHCHHLAATVMQAQGLIDLPLHVHFTDASTNINCPSSSTARGAHGRPRLPQLLVQLRRGAVLGAQARRLLGRKPRQRAIVQRRRARRMRRRARRRVGRAWRQRRQRQLVREHVVAALRRNQESARAQTRCGSLAQGLGYVLTCCTHCTGSCPLPGRMLPHAPPCKQQAGHSPHAFPLQLNLIASHRFAPDIWAPIGYSGRRACCMPCSDSCPLPGRAPPAMGGKSGPAGGACAGTGRPRRARSMR